MTANPPADPVSPPWSLADEQALLSCVLSPNDGGAAALDAIADLDARDFFRPCHRSILEAARAVAERGAEVNLHSVASELRARGELEKIGDHEAAGVDYLNLIDSFPSGIDAALYADRVRKLAQLRALMTLGLNMTQDAAQAGADPREIMGRVERDLDGLRARDGRGNGLVPLSSVAPESVTWLWDPYIPSGKLTLLEGDPAAGKTWLALAFAAAVSRGRGLPMPMGDLHPRVRRGRPST